MQRKLSSGFNPLFIQGKNVIEIFLLKEERKKKSVLMPSKRGDCVIDC